MKCSECGTEVEDNVTICPNCGYEIVDNCNADWND